MIKELKNKLDSDDFTLFVFVNYSKSEKQLKRILNSYLLRFLIYIRYRKVYAK